MFMNKQKKIEKLMESYQQQVVDCFKQFDKAFQKYLANHDRNELAKDFSEIHSFESKADDIRREVEEMMYSKSLFPESRGDIMGLLETVDKVPNKAEDIVRRVLNQRINIPKEYAYSVLELVKLACRSAITLVESMECLFSNFSKATRTVGIMDEIESQADCIEADIIERIFSSNMDNFDKLQLRDLTVAISEVCDRVMNAGDKIRIIVAKRRV